MIWANGNSVRFQIVERGKIQPRFCVLKIQGGIDQCRTYDFAEQSVNSGMKGKSRASKSASKSASKELIVGKQIIGADYALRVWRGTHLACQMLRGTRTSLGEMLSPKTLCRRHRKAGGHYYRERKTDKSVCLYIQSNRGGKGGDRREAGTKRTDDDGLHNSEHHG